MAFLNNERASFSSFTRQWNYDVFLSFRGEDTREGFTSHLYKALCDKGINTFVNDKLKRGEKISEELIQAIKKSSILVIVFSKNYVESKWCLDELAEIVECREKDQEVQIRPVFYNVDPSKIRNQEGNIRRALDNHEKKFKNNNDKVQRWRDALSCSTYKSESHFIQNIVEEISNAKLNRTPLYVAGYPVGINSGAEGIKSLLEIGLDEVCVVEIYGLPGVGKTKIAKAVYNRIAKHFDGSSFLMNVRENLGRDASIITLQEQLLNDILVDGNWKVGNRFRGISMIEKRLCCKKVGEAIPLSDASVDAVVGTLVLCSVKDVDMTLKEVKRVLRPGGIYLFVEYVAAKDGTVLRFIQNVLDLCNKQLLMGVTLPGKQE